MKRDFFDLRISSTFPNTLGASRMMEQFHLCDCSWYWHSDIPSLAPSLIAYSTIHKKSFVSAKSSCKSKF